ncbi:MAG: ATP-binding protein [Candidatus Omnitrophica bacterium]|nr:ATP-binding protein [Candidatus Omnitrophota bacterium]
MKPSVQEQFEIKSDPKELQGLREKVSRLIHQLEFSEKAANDILVALGEGCTNATRHSYEGKLDQPIHIRIEGDSKKIKISIRDFGRKIDLSKIKTPKLPPDKPGGLGIYFMQTMMDQIEYNTKHPEGNELILTKYNEQGESRENPS